MNDILTKSEKVLHVPQGSMTHLQVGQIIALAAEIGNDEHAKALEYIKYVHTEADAAHYIASMVAKLDGE